MTKISQKSSIVKLNYDSVTEYDTDMKFGPETNITPIQDGRGPKKPPISFSPVTSTNVALNTF